MQHKMKDANIISWIFLSIGLASEKSPADYNEISQIADGINHAIPTTQELKISINWLEAHDLIKKSDKRYLLTAAGESLISDIEKGTNNLLNIWKNIENKIQNDYD